jgi:hypothetical protein
VTWLAAWLIVAATIACLLLVVPVARRTGLGTWHPAVAWLALEVVFFGLGSAIIAVRDGRPGPALYVGAAFLAFGIAVAASDRLAVRRGARPGSTSPGVDEAVAGREPEGSTDIRPAVVVGLAFLGLLALVPTLVSVGIPALAGDITGARSEVGGLDLQVLRVTLPAAVLVAVIRALRAADRRSRLIALIAFLVAVTAELALASRYLAVELVAAIVLAVAILGRPIPARILIAVGLVGALLFAGVGVLRAYDQAAGRELAFAAERTVNRIVLIEPRTLDALQSVIPSEEPFFGGLTWFRRLGPLFGRDDIPNLGYWIYPRLFPDQAVPGYAAPGVVGEAWANFGVLGIGLFALLGLVVERLGALVAMRRRETADVAAAGLAILFVARTHALGLNGVAILIVLVIAWRLLVAPVGALARDARAIVTWRS